MTPYAFFLDIDDTILWNGTVSPRVVSAMAEAREKGHFVFINTGRAPAFMDPPLQKIPVDGFVCGCGAYIELRGEEIFRAEYPTEALKKWMHRFSHAGEPGFVVEGIHRIFRYRNSFWRPRPD